ncbi:hypothetical protein WJX72_003992 [[Myrmecia] bisecta]|uniref:Protein kinase domain-containing protein n=1 Tax=[Myrmecia] bisecta TaxID=41462 RepID=A0AAW1PD03_9CHLO
MHCKIGERLLDRKTDINATSGLFPAMQSQAILYAAGAGQWDALLLLKSMGGDINERDPLDNTGMHIAVLSGAHMFETLQLLLALGADPSIKNNLGRTPLDLLILQMETLRDFSDALLGGFKGHEEATLKAITLLQAVAASVRGPLASLPIPRGKWGCTCGQCLLDGCLSPRMMCRLRITAEVLADIMRDNINTMVESWPASVDDTGMIFGASWLPVQFQQQMSKRFAKGYEAGAQMAAALLNANTPPTAAALNAAIGATTLPLDRAARLAYGHYIQQGGRAEFVIDAIVGIAIEQSEATGDGEFLEIHGAPTPDSRLNLGPYLGAPLPSKEALEGVINLKSRVSLIEPQANLDRITRLAANVFNMPIAMIEIIDNRASYIKSGHNLPSLMQPRLLARKMPMCPWGQIPDLNEVIVVEDTLEEGRWRESPLVAKDPKFRFYAGAPLVTLEGYRLGTLHVCDFVPRQFDTACGTLLANFAQLATRELERPEQLPGQPTAEAQRGKDKWPMLYCNELWTTITGVGADSAIGKPFWDLYRVLGASKETSPWQAFQPAIRANELFQEDVAEGGGSGQHSFTITFKPASRDFPGWPLAWVQNRHLGGCPFDDVQVGPPLGRGAYGSVFHGDWNGAAVAVKVVDHKMGDMAIEEANKEFEAMLGMKLAHPNIVRAFKYAVAPRKVAVWRAQAGDGLPLPMGQDDKIDRGGFRTKRSSYTGSVNLPWVLRTLLDVASAMMYIHGQDILHGDKPENLSCTNVLLVLKPGTDDRPFAAKLSDFGLARMLLSGGAVEAHTCRTVTHMPPELLTQGRLSKASDVYSFGILMWAVYTGRRPWAGLRHVQILAKKMMGTCAAPDFPDHTPPAYRELGERCMSADDQARPTFATVVAALKTLIADVQAGSVRVPDFPVYPLEAYIANMQDQSGAQTLPPNASDDQV